MKKLTVMKGCLLPLLAAVGMATGCTDYGTESDTPDSDTIVPVIKLEGKQTDTAYLGASYWDKGAYVVDGPTGKNSCEYDYIKIKQTGVLTTGIAGTYYFYYNAHDNKGNQLATVTRTIHVTENSAAFLNGVYNVACTCSAAVNTTPNSPTVTTTNYLASVTTSTANKQFELSAIKTGPVNEPSRARLRGDSVYYEYNNVRAAGSVSATKKSFTIQTVSLNLYPVIATYTCKNVYTKP